MVTLYLVRHGETEWNRIGRWQGHADVPLSERGWEQAEALAQRLKREGGRFDAVYTSDLSRAFQTAQVVAEGLGLPIQKLRQLREIDVGVWSGLTRAEIQQRFPGAHVTVDHAPGGETHDDFAARVWDAMTALAHQPNRTLLVVTHGGVIRAALRHIYALMEQPDIAVPPIDNTSITVVQFDDGRWEMLRTNDAAHLQTEAVPDAVPPRDEGNVLG